MKKSRNLVIVMAALLLAGCGWFDVITYYEPEYLTYEDLRRSILPEEPREMTETGKIYVAGNHLFVNEYHEGIHVVDISDPDNPVKISFVPIPGNVDVAVRGSTLYADSYVDLVALDISDPLAVTEIGRLTDVFPHNEWLPWFGVWTYGDVYGAVDEELGIVTGWNIVDTEVRFSPGYEVVYADGALNSGGTGTGGSMARFTVVDEYLYALHDGYLELFDISVPASPAEWARVSLDWDIETIFPYQDRLFIGSMTGMYIFDNTDPANPIQLSEFTHATSCDPVVATATRAYVTLRSGSLCGGGDDELDIIDITNLAEPELVSSYAMWGPYGLGIDGTTLFVCDGSAGLKIYDASDDLDLVLLEWFKDIETYDAILLGGTALVVGSGGLHIYDYSNLLDITKRGTIAVGG